VPATPWKTGQFVEAKRRMNSVAACAVRLAFYGSLRDRGSRRGELAPQDRFYAASPTSTSVPIHCHVFVEWFDRGTNNDPQCFPKEFASSTFVTCLNQCEMVGVLHKRELRLVNNGQRENEKTASHRHDRRKKLVYLLISHGGRVSASDVYSGVIARRPPLVMFGRLC